MCSTRSISHLGAWLLMPASVHALPVVSRALINQPSANTVNLTALNTDISEGWVSNPDNRGTWNILSNCIFTLSLCVFTAIHLNVGPPGETGLQFWLRKLKWVIVATFAPEMVLYTAGKQWFSATRLCKKLNNWRVRNDDKSPETLSKEVKDADPTDSQTIVRSPVTATEKRLLTNRFDGFKVFRGTRALSSNLWSFCCNGWVSCGCEPHA